MSAGIDKGGVFPVEKLKGIQDYHNWKFAMKMILIHEDLWDCVEPVETQKVDAKRDMRALAKICLAVQTTAYPHVRNASTAQAAWNNLQRAYEDKGLCRRLSLLRSLFGTKLENNDMDTYLSKVTAIVQQLDDIGSPLDDDFVAVIMLSGLPQEYDPLIMTLENNNTELSSEEVKSKLLQKHQRRDDKDTVSALVVKKPVKCYGCKKTGHILRNCPQRAKKSKNKQSPAKEESPKALLSALSSNLRRDVWYVDSGATNHMCNNRDIMSDFSSDKVLSVNIANGDKLYTAGQGSVRINLTDCAFLKKNGIIHQKTVPYSPAQNGVSERANRTIVEKARCVLQDAGLDQRFWAEAVQLAVYIKNRTPTKAVMGATPEEKWTGKKIYKGLDIVTAKATPQERAAAPHHLLDILEPHQMFTVVDFRNRALKIIDNVTEQGKIPIIVGGTHYYMESIVYQILVENMDDSESLLWDKSRRKRDLDKQDTEDDEKNSKKISLDKASASDIVPKASSSDVAKKEDEVVVGNKEKLQADIDNEKSFTNEEIHGKLKEIDPVMAKRLHPNNRRKVLRSIEVWLKSGRRHSEILDQQQLSEGKLRRPGATIVFWLTCQQEVHDRRLNARVDAMIDQGLIEELLDFHIRHNQQRIQDGQSPDYTKGIFQTLGFKEFHDYLMMTQEQRDSDEGKKLLQESIENMKMATRRFARRQNKMVRGRFLNHPRREVPPVYELDTTDLSKWDELVKNKAIKILECYLNETPTEFMPMESCINEEERSLDTKSNNFCEICNRIIIGDKEYAIHLKSNRHMKVLKMQKKKQSASTTIKEQT